MMNFVKTKLLQSSLFKYNIINTNKQYCLNYKILYSLQISNFSNKNNGIKNNNNNNKHNNLSNPNNNKLNTNSNINLNSNELISDFLNEDSDDANINFNNKDLNNINDLNRLSDVNKTANGNTNPENNQKYIENNNNQLEIDALNEVNDMFSAFELFSKNYNIFSYNEERNNIIFNSFSKIELDYLIIFL